MTCIAPSRFTHRLVQVAPGASSAMLLVLLVSGCGPGAATPVPEPPALQGGRVGIPATIVPLTNTVTLAGAAGAATPHATVLATDLDSTAASVATSAAADGSFSITIPTNADDEQRLVAIVDGVRSAPYDFKLVGNEVVASPRPTCLAVNPGLLVSVRPGDEVNFSFDNSCGSTVSLQAPRARLGDASVSFDPQFQASIPSGGSGTFSVNVASNAASTLDEVVFVDVNVNGQSIRYPLGIYARGK